MLSKGTNICGYTVVAELEDGYYYDCYQVKNTKGTLFTLKLIDLDLAPSTRKLDDETLKESATMVTSRGAMIITGTL